MAISLVRSGQVVGGTDVTIAVSAGDLIVLSPAVYAPNYVDTEIPWSSATISDSAGNAYTVVFKNPQLYPRWSTDGKTLPYLTDLAHAVAKSSATITITVNMISANYPTANQDVLVHIYSGVDSAAPLYGSGFSGHAGANCSYQDSSVAQTPTPGYLKFSTLHTEQVYNSVTVTHDPGTIYGAFVKREHAVQSSSYQITAEDFVDPGLSSLSADWVNPDCNGAILVALFKPAADVTPMTVAPDGITVSVTLGAPTVGDAVVFPDGLSVPVTLGAPTLSWSATAAPGGIGIPVALGAPAVGVVSVSPAGIAVAVTVGSPTLTDGSMALAPGGITVPVALGAPTLSGVGTAAPDGVSVPVGLGSPALSWSGVVAPDGITAPVAVGSPTVVGAGVSPDGIAVGVALGSPALSWSGSVNPDGTAVPVSLGAPGVSMPGALVIRPDTGTAARPTAGITARPNTGTTTRPGTDTVTRPNTGIVARP